MSHKKAAAKPAMLSVKEIAKTAVKIETPAAKAPEPVAAPVASAPAKKPAAKAAKSAAKKPAAKKAAAPAKKTAAKKAAAPAPVSTELYVQFQGFEVSEQDLLALVRADYPGEIRALRLYVKPEEHAAYYVVNENDTGVVYF